MEELNTPTHACTAIKRQYTGERSPHSGHSTQTLPPPPLCYCAVQGSPARSAVTNRLVTFRWSKMGI